MNQATTKSIYAVVGNPISQSKSPRIHKLFAEQTGEPISYGTIEPPVDEFPKAIAHFFDKGGAGLNITAPFKEQAFAIAEQHSDRAKLASAVNTLWRKDGSLYGDNTDGVGLIRDLTQNHHINLQGKTILLLGAGGAARGALPSLLAEGPARVIVINRTTERAKDMVAAQDAIARNTNVQLSVGDYDSPLLETPCDLIINTVPLDQQHQVPSVSSEMTAADCRGYDMIYADGPTVFQVWAGNNGIQSTPDGLGMLVEQAAESFYQWREVRPETAPVIAALRQT